jgi:hypothetical protein
MLNKLILQRAQEAAKHGEVFVVVPEFLAGVAESAYKKSKYIVKTPEDLAKDLLKLSTQSSFKTHVDSALMGDCWSTTQQLVNDMALDYYCINMFVMCFDLMPKDIQDVFKTLSRRYTYVECIESTGRIKPLNEIHISYPEEIEAICRQSPFPVTAILLPKSLRELSLKLIFDFSSKVIPSSSVSPLVSLASEFYYHFIRYLATTDIIYVDSCLNLLHLHHRDWKLFAKTNSLSGYLEDAAKAVSIDELPTNTLKESILKGLLSLVKTAINDPESTKGAFLNFISQNHLFLDSSSQLFKVVLEHGSEESIFREVSEYQNNALKQNQLFVCDEDDLFNQQMDIVIVVVLQGESNVQARLKRASLMSDRVMQVNCQWEGFCNESK